MKTLKEKLFKENINENKIWIRFVFIMIFLITFVMNILSPLVADDYSYKFSFYNGERIHNLKDIIYSMYNHYFYLNGRMVSHSIVHIVDMFPKGLFDILNSLVFVIFIMVVYQYCKEEQKHNVFLLMMIMAAIWKYVPVYGQVFLWLDGACNYLWTLTFVLLYVYPYKLYFDGKSIFNEKWKWISYCILGILVGDLSESASFCCLIASVIFSVLSGLYKKRQIKLWMVSSIVCQMIGYIFLMKAPGLSYNQKIAISGIEKYYVNFLQVLDQYKTFCLSLFVAWIVLFVCSVIAKIKSERIIYSSMFLIMSLMLNFIHIFSKDYPHRSMLSCTICLIISIGVLIPELMTIERYKVLIYSGGLAVILFAFIDFFPAVYDIAYVNREFRARETIIEKEKDNGNYNITVNSLHPSTKYSAAYELECDPRNDDSSYWVNSCMAKYYEVDSILGE